MSCPSHKTGLRVVTSAGKPWPLLNPGPLAGLHHKCHAILPIWLDGVRVNYQNIAHSSVFFDGALSNIWPSGVRCGYTFMRNVGNNMEKSPFMSIDLNPHNLSSNIHVEYNLLPSLHVEWKGQIMPVTKHIHGVKQNIFDKTLAFGTNVWTIDLYGASSTLSFNIYNNGLKLGRTSVSFLRNLTPNLAMGAECLFDWNDSIWHMRPALAARFSCRRTVIAATYSPTAGDMDMTYWHQASPSVQMGTSAVYNGYHKKLIGSIFLQREFAKAIVRAKCDSETNIGIAFDQIRNTHEHSVGMSFLWCIRTNRFLWGFNFNIDPQ